MTNPNEWIDPSSPSGAKIKKRKRSAIFIVIAVSLAVHLLAGGVLAIIKITEKIAAKPEFEAPPLEKIDTPPPPPPPPPTTKRSVKSMPRPQPLVVQNPQNMSVPAIEIDQSQLTIGGGRGFGGGLGEIGGGALDAVRLTSFGYDQALEGTLTGTLYDLKTDRNRKPISYSSNLEQAASPIFKDFTRNFDLNKLSRKFFRADTTLYASYFVINNQPAGNAPKAFQAEGVIEPKMICASYTGTYKPTESGRFRLFGRGDDVLVVSINGKIVLDASWRTEYYSGWKQGSSAAREDEKNPRSYFGFKPAGITGDWFDLRAGVMTEVDIVVAEVPGGWFGGYLLIEKEGQPGMEIFTTRPFSTQDRNFLLKVHPDVRKFMK